MTATETIRFTGKERDAETGLDYFGYRYMSGAQGRFTSPDPDNYDARLEQPQSWNMYAYTWNNPLKYRDDDGRAVNLALAGIGAGVGFGTGFVGSAVSQYIQNGSVDWGTAAAYGAGGAVSGATAGFTFGGSLVAQAVAGIGVAAAGNVAGGVTARTLAGEDALDTDALSSDLENGLVGGTLGAGVQYLGTVANLPVKPKGPTPLANVRTSLKRMAKLREWERQRNALSNRFSAVGATFGSMYTNVVTQVSSAWDNRQNWLSSLWFEMASRQQQQKPEVKSKICYVGEAGCPAQP
jgi:RHS repeat-associated protein